MPQFERNAAGRFHVTYEIVTPESAALHADAAERGFVDAFSVQHELPADVFGEEAGAIKRAHALRLRDAFNLFGFRAAMEDSGHWFSEADSDVDHSTGAETRMSFHPPDNVTGASYQRLTRLFRLG